LSDVHATESTTADLSLLGQKVQADRRGFLRSAGLATMGAMMGMTIPFHRNTPHGLITAAFAQDDLLQGKDGLTRLSDRPVNAETPAHLLDDAITPTNRNFIRNSGLLPDNIDA
jgi:hypothetical protein